MKTLRSEVWRATSSLIAPKTIACKGRCQGLACRILAALPVFGMVGSAQGQGSPQDQTGSPVTPLIGGFVMTRGTAIDWANYPGATLGLVGDLGSNNAATVVILPLEHAAMSVDDWLELGIDPADAAAMIGGLLPGQGLAAVLDLDGRVRSVAVTECGGDPSASNTVVVTAPPNSPPMTIEEWVELLVRLLQEYKRQLQTGNDPNGAW